jgi:hypothetical protein
MLLLAVMIRNHRNCFDLNEKFWVCQPDDNQYGNKRGIGPLSPEALKHLESRLQWLSLNNIDSPFNCVFQSSFCSGKRNFKIFKCLLSLSANVAFANDIARRVYRILATNIDRAHLPLGDNHLGESWIIVQPFRTYVFDAHSLFALFVVFIDGGCAIFM